MKIRYPMLFAAATMFTLAACDRRDGAATRDDATVRDTATMTVPRQDTVQVERTTTVDTVRDTRPADRRP